MNATKQGGNVGYVEKELNSVKPDLGFIRVKFHGDGETKWLNITPKQYEKIKKILLRDEKEAT